MQALDSCRLGVPVVFSGHIPRLGLNQALHLSGATFANLGQVIGPIGALNAFRPCHPCPNQFGGIGGLLAAWIRAPLGLGAVVVVSADHHAPRGA